MRSVILALGFTGVALTLGCSATGSKEEVMRDYISSQELKQDYLVEQEKLMQKKASSFLKALPEWYLNPPRSDEKGIYAVSEGASHDLSSAIRKAELQANYSLSTKVKNLVSGEETMTGGSDSEYRFIINSFVNQIDISGSEPILRTIKVIDGKYHAFIMMLYPYSSLHSDMIKASSSNDSMLIDSVYKQLMKRIKEVR